jgi:hypothetical protein
MPSQLESKKVKDDLELEWLLCMASAFKSSQRIQPTEAGETLRRGGFPRSKNQKLFASVLKRVFDLARKES